MSIEEEVENTLLDIGINNGLVYPWSNEKLSGMFSKINISGKDVLTVLASSDQLFHFYYRDAKHVDVFDKVKPTLYYLYLRIWIIEYLEYYHAPFCITKSFVENLLKLVVPKTEEEAYAYKFWSIFERKADVFDNEYFFIDGGTTDRRNTELYNLDLIKKKLAKRDFQFYNIDISEPVSMGRKYDIIFTSNIRDYITDLAHFRIYKNNLDNLLNDDGIIISSNVCKNGPGDLEKHCFFPDFEIEDIIVPNEIGKSRTEGYIYRRREHKL